MKYEKGQNPRKLSRQALMLSAMDAIVKETRAHITNIEYGKGSIFDYGKNAVCHFKIKECKGWRFAFWISEITETYKERNPELVFFCTPELTIDKFKPSRAAFSSYLKRFTFKPNESDKWETCWDLGNTIEIIEYIRKHPHKAFYYGSNLFPQYIYNEVSIFHILKSNISFKTRTYYKFLKTSLKKIIMTKKICHLIKKIKNINAMLIDDAPDFQEEFIQCVLDVYINKSATDEDINNYEDLLEYLNDKYYGDIMINERPTKESYIKVRNYYIKNQNKTGSSKILWMIGL